MPFPGSNSVPLSNQNLRQMPGQIQPPMNRLPNQVNHGQPGGQNGMAQGFIPYPAVSQMNQQPNIQRNQQIFNNINMMPHQNISNIQQYSRQYPPYPFSNQNIPRSSQNNVPTMYSIPNPAQNAQNPTRCFRNPTTSQQPNSAQAQPPSRARKINRPPNPAATQDSSQTIRPQNVPPSSAQTQPQLARRQQQPTQPTPVRINRCKEAFLLGFLGRIVLRSRFTRY